MPVPALPDTARLTTYTISASAGPFDVDFDLYGDGIDYQNWVEVWLDGVKLTAVTDWTLSSPSGSLAFLPRPIVDAEITFTSDRTGDVIIVGARRPRRMTQLTEGQAVSAATLNRTFTDMIAAMREQWDRFERTPFFVPGYPATEFPAPEDGKAIGWDGTTLSNVTIVPIAGTLTLATQAKAEAGVDNLDYMSALRTKQAITSQVPAIAASSAAALVTIGHPTGLTAERALAATSGVKLTDGGANGAVTVAFGDQNLAEFAIDNFPMGDDCNVRVAAGVDGHSIGLVYIGDGNGLWLRDPFTGKYRKGFVNGAFQIIDLQNCTIDGVPGQSVPAAVTHYIYAYFAAAGDLLFSTELSSTTFTVGFEGPVVKGWRFKNDVGPTFNKRLIGAVKSDAAGVFWRDNTAHGVPDTGVFMSGVNGAFKRQVLNYHTLCSGGNGSPTLAEINSNQYLSAFMWEDGNEPYIGIGGSVQSDTAGAVVTIAVGIDGAAPTSDFQDITCDAANKPYPFGFPIKGGDFDTNLHTYRVFMKNSAGNGIIVGNRAAGTGARLAMKLEQ